MKIVFAGTPDVAVPTLVALSDAGHEISAVLTRPDAPVGRKRVLTPSPVAQFALDHDIPVIYAHKVTDEVSSQLRELGADLGVVVAYGGLLPDDALSALRLGWINLHFSALPLWRGAAPVQWTLISGQTTTASTIFQLVTELDAGDIFDAEKICIDSDETSGMLLSRMSLSGAHQVVRVVNSLQEGTAHATAQHGEPSYARKLTLEDAHLDPTESGHAVFDRFRGVTPEPGAFVYLGDDRLKIHEATLSKDESIPAGSIIFSEGKTLLGTSTQALELHVVQPAGKSRMSAADWFRGLRQESVQCR